MTRGPAPQPWDLTGRGLIALGVFFALVLCFAPWGPS